MPLKVLITRLLLATACLSICTAAVAILDTSDVDAESSSIYQSLGNTVCPTPSPTPTPTATPTATSTPTPSGTATATPTATPSPGCPPIFETVSFVNPGPISPLDRVSNEPTTDPGLPGHYPSSIIVESPPRGGLAHVEIRFGVTSEALNDLDILLVAPDGRRSLVISDGGYAHAVIGHEYTFIHGFTPFPFWTVPFPGSTHGPSNYNGLCTSEPHGQDNFPGIGGLMNYPTNFAAFSGASAEGVWSLFVVDDETGNLSSLPIGWTLILTFTRPYGTDTCNPPTATPLPPTPPVPPPTPGGCSSPGRRDTTFGSDGIVRTPILNGNDTARALAIQGDGKIVAAGHGNLAGSQDDFALVRYNRRQPRPVIRK
jgi:subtilisin-like proprotein convertase family protein